MESKVFFLLFSIIIIIIILFVCEMHFHFERTKKNIFTIENYSGWIVKCCCCCCCANKKNKNQTHKNKQFESIEHFEIKQKKKQANLFIKTGKKTTKKSTNTRTKLESSPIRLWHYYWILNRKISFFNDQ